MAVGAITKQAVDRLAPRLRGGPARRGPPLGCQAEWLWCEGHAERIEVVLRPVPDWRARWVGLIAARSGPTVRLGRRLRRGRRPNACLGSVKRGVDPQEQKKTRKREGCGSGVRQVRAALLGLVYGERAWSGKTLADNKRYLTAKDGPVAVLGRKPLTGHQALRCRGCVRSGAGGKAGLGSEPV
jgi:hypothetical protein